jgi:hypothetical protein
VRVTWRVCVACSVVIGLGGGYWWLGGCSEVVSEWVTWQAGAYTLEIKTAGPSPPSRVDLSSSLVSSVSRLPPCVLLACRCECRGGTRCCCCRGVVRRRHCWRVAFVTWHSHAAALSSVNAREGAAGLLTWGAGDVASRREAGTTTGGRGGGGGGEERSDVSRLQRVSRFGRGRTTGPPRWDIITLCSLHGNASVAQLARSPTFVPEALGSILRYCIFFFPF